MRVGHQARDLLDGELVRLQEEQLVVLPLDRLEDLLCEPDVDSFSDSFSPRRGPYRSGVDDLTLTLAAAKRLPDQLTVRIVLSPETPATIPRADVEAALHRRAADMASESWREAMATRSMGRRQTPLGIGIGIVAAVIAYTAGYLATVADTAAGRGALVVVAMIALTVAWVVGWVVVEAAILDWRLPARRAAACELLATATLEIASDASGG
jgi:hypothetical protein